MTRKEEHAEEARAAKIRENRLRRAANRQELALMKCPRRDPRAFNYGTYMIVNPSMQTIVAKQGVRYGLTLDEIELLLNDPDLMGR
jgi:hypothetical protein